MQQADTCILHVFYFEFAKGNKSIFILKIELFPFQHCNKNNYPVMQ